jgi:phospholipase/lecithinase/hemolysin
MNSNPKLAAIMTLVVTLAARTAPAQSPPLVGIGDSLGEGVQSANAFAESQPNSYLKRFSEQMGVPFSQPLLSTSLFASIYSDAGRARLHPDSAPADLAVSGATTENVLTATASADTPNTEADLVLPPYVGLSQMQIVEQLRPQMVVAWVGNDDLISQVLSFDDLGSQSGVTPLPTFTADYQELVARLKSTGARVVMSNVPNITQIAFLFDNDDLTRYTGTNYNLPAGYVTSLPTMLLLKLGVFDGSILNDPHYVLTPTQLSAIEQQVQQYNQVIERTAAAAAIPVVDAYAVFEQLIENPITIEGITINTHYNGGAFSLDGVHPSDTGYAVFTNQFIEAADTAYGLAIPPISPSQLVQIFNADPFIDFGGHGVVKGRAFTGLLETLGPFLGISGGPGGAGSRAPAGEAGKPTAAEFMRQYYLATGQNPDRSYTDKDVIDAVKDMLGLASR